MHEQENHVFKGLQQTACNETSVSHHNHSTTLMTFITSQ